MRKTCKLAACSLALGLIVAAAFAFVDVAHAATLSAASFADPHLMHYIAPAVFAVAANLEGMRTQHADLTRRAADKMAELKDGLSPEQIRAIEDDHAEIVRNLAAVSAAMTTEEQRARPAPGPTNEAAIAAERLRSSEITRLATRHAMPADFASQHINAGTALDQVRSLVLDHVATQAESTRINPRTRTISDEGDALRNAVTAAIQLRAAPGSIPANTEENRTLIAAARNWRGMSLLEMGRVFLEETTGQRVRGLSKMELATVVLGLPSLGGRRDLSGAMSTSDFPSILANVVNKRLRDSYQTAPQTWKAISRQSNSPDFKAKSVVQLSNLPKFKQVREGQEYSYAALSEGAASYALATYGNIVPITRQTLINDDLGAFDRLPVLQGRAAAETEASIFWALFTANAGLGATMEDTHALFDAENHANYTTPGTDISVASLDVGRASMRTQKGFGDDPEPLNLTPKFILVSPAKETKAQQFLASITATKGGDINPFANSLQQITEARLSGNGWYLIADASQIDTIEYAYLEGEEGLYTETRFGFEVDGIEVKARLDFAAHIIDHRGFYLNAGA